jgi:cell division protein FtsQ
MAVVAVPWWGKAGLQRLDFFHVRAVEVVGTRYLDPSVVVQRLEVDTLHSVWNELAPLAQRLRTHPLIRDVEVGRRLPGTLVVTVTERTPVAFVATADGLQVSDAEGNVLPIDPSRHTLDLPVLTAPDTSVLRLLDELRTSHSGLYARLSDVRREPPHELSFQLYTTTIRARADVSAQRLADIQLVEADLARRQQHAVELDLRFRDQVIARLP